MIAGAGIEPVALRTRSLGRACTLRQAIAALEGNPHSAVLALTPLGAHTPRHTILLYEPVDRIVFLREDSDCPFQALEAAMRRWPGIGAGVVPTDVPFRGAWVGYFTYEAGLRTERLRATHLDALHVPLLAFALYDAAAVFDHATQSWTAVAVEWPSAPASNRPGALARLGDIGDRLSFAGRSAEPPAPPAGTGAVQRQTTSANMSREQYLGRVERIREYLAAGDAYQVNLSVRFDVPTRLTPTQLFLRLLDVNPSPHAALLQYDDFAVVSASPELFLHIDGRAVVTRPIKGTRPRTCDAAMDAAAADDLSASAKDRAELAMIVDLLRNDLGRVCEFGSIRVVDDGAIESHPTVLHRVATIEGRLRDGARLADVLRATCPGGSVTGAPKIRAMQIIDELEPTPRGAYCGSIGWIGLDGRASLNLAIRTMTLVEGKAVVHAGGGIVFDSVGELEYAEVQAKAQGMMQSLGANWPSG